PAQTRQAAQILQSLGTQALIHQPVYSMFNRWIEEELLDVLADAGMGCIVFSPLAQGLLTDRYLQGIPEDSRAASPAIFLQREDITDEYLWQAQRLNAIAQERGQSLAQMAIAWVLRHPGVTSALVGASKVSQLEANVAALDRLDFSDNELAAIDGILDS
ncbi:MAG: aldo/keto reductase, partial [Anaerolineales bacterium]|nr:aldo/keto reductase [Anaerolineales bacterium]